MPVFVLNALRVLRSAPSLPMGAVVQWPLRFLLFLAVCAGALVPATQMNAGAASRVDGVVSDITWYMTRAEMDKSIALMQQAGVKTIRANINWSSVEPNTKGALDAWWLTEIDYAVAKAQSAGIEVMMPISDGVPYWAS
ncbi:MAG: cellulase family glycosylhydrolase, partial [Gemmatimonadaceae bacterium]|nr:cellulase family glycosylhydrolase [Gemmatimonadaceae bacterium]